MVFFAMGYTFLRLDRFSAIPGKRKKLVESRGPTSSKCDVGKEKAKQMPLRSSNGRQKAIFSSQDEIVALLGDCLRRRDVNHARNIDDRLRKTKVKFTGPMYDNLLKVYALAGDEQAFSLFAELRQSEFKVTEGLCVGLLARCAESKFLRFAEAVAEFVESSGQKTLLVYSALMKVYAHAGMYDKACDLYDDVISDGLEPDSMMYGCLMKFATECGRTTLSRLLSERAPFLDIQNYMSLIRAAGRDRDVKQAFSVLDRLKSSGVAIDIAAYNCVLDVCASCGDMTSARSLVDEMKHRGALDVITYNTLLKGYCQQGDLAGAKSVMNDIRQAGQQPNDISFNLLLNAAISASDFVAAWQTVEHIERNGTVDHYTISIIMKGLKKMKSKDSRHLQQALALLDRSNINVCSDEILLNTVVEACMWYKDISRLKSFLAAFAESDLRPSLTTYGPLIKAASMLRCLDTCWELWGRVVDGRSPSEIALGCMLDALVTNNCLDSAVRLFDEWKDLVKPNTVMFSTLAKGFATSRQPGRAMELWHDMHRRNVRLNTVVCNAIIDAQARSGMMDEVSHVVTVMEQQGCPLDVITFSTIIKGYCVKGDLDKAFEIFRNTQKSGLITDAVIYNTLLDGCLRHNRIELAEQVAEEMEQHNIVPTNFTLGILVKMYGRRHQLDKAFLVVESLSQRHGFKINTQVKTCLISACVNNRAVDRALQVFADLRKSREQLDSKTYGALISGCVRFGRLPAAIELVEDAYGLQASSARGLPPGESLERERLEQVLKHLQAASQMENVGLPLLERLRAAEPMASQLIMSSLGTRGSNAEIPSKPLRPWRGSSH